jgi:glutamate dehydrogenase (NAD(P)+)
MTSPQHMLWMMDEYEVLHGGKYPGMITGKPVGMGGSRGRTQATGYGVVYTLREALRELDLDPADTTASVQGFGNVSQYAIELYHRLGGRTVCVSCWDQQDRASYAYFKRDGIDLKELRGITDGFGGIDKAGAADLGYEVLDGNAWLDREVDILLPCALENQLTSESAACLSPRVKIVAEGANGPTTPEADAVLRERNVFVIPDFLANAGGVTCSYFEQVQSNQNFFWEEGDVLSRLDVKMTSAFHDVHDVAQRRRVPMRDAAYMVAIGKVAAACRDRGWV